MIRLIASDVDGTLVKEGSDSINPEYYDVISRLCEKGIRFCIASGRQFTSVRKLFGPVADRIFYIAEGGGVLRSYDEIFHLEPLPLEDMKALLDECRELPDIDQIIATSDFSFAENEDTPMYRLLAESYGFDMKAIDSFNNAPLDQVVKVSLFHETDIEKALGTTLVPRWKDKFQIVCSGNQWIDCLSLNTSKGQSLQTLQKRFGITKEETMVFGDNMNDLSMFHQAKYSYAIGNAREEVKKEAAYVADTYSNDGVLKELKKLL